MDDLTETEGDELSPDEYSESIEEAIERLSWLNPVQYGIARAKEAQKIGGVGVSVAFLDQAVKDAAKLRKANEKQTEAPRKMWEEYTSHDGRPGIEMIPGRLDLIADNAERVVLEAEFPLFQRCGGLVRPAVSIVKGMKGRDINLTSLVNVDSVAIRDILSKTANFVRWSERGWNIIDVPLEVAAIINSRRGVWKFPIVDGIITCPTIRPDGSILSKGGYDPMTRLYHEVDRHLKLAQCAYQPTHADAVKSLDTLCALLSEFPFVTPASKSVALSAIIVAVCRRSMPMAPIHIFRATTAGTGKTYLVDVISTIAMGKPCAAMAASRDEKETDARLNGLLLAGYPIVSLDNVNGEFGSDILAQAVSGNTLALRPLGRSDIVNVDNTCTIFATGNGTRVRADLVRRTLICDLDAKMERPQQRQFGKKPVDMVMEDRGKYVSAAIAIVRAYIDAGCPDRVPALAGFSDWSDLVCSALVWLGCDNPLETQDVASLDDPHAAELREMLACWEADIGLNRPLTVAGIVGQAQVKQELYDAILNVAADRGAINNRRFGKWLGLRRGQISSGMRLVNGDVSHGLATWVLEKVKEGPTGLDDPNNADAIEF